MTMAIVMTYDEEEDDDDDADVVDDADDGYK